MSTQNVGNQVVTFRYRNPANASDFGKIFNKIIKAGIYDGGVLSMAAPNIMRIAAFVALFRTSAGQAVRIITTQNVESDLNSGSPLIPITEINPYIIGNYTWVDSETNYLDFYAKAIGDIYDDDIVFGKALFSAGSVVGFSYSEKTWGLFDQQGNIYVENNLILKENLLFDGLAAFPREIDETTLKADKNYFSVSPLGFKNNTITNFEDGTILQII